MAWLLLRRKEQRKMKSLKVYSAIKYFGKNEIVLKEEANEKTVLFSECVFNYRKITGRSNSNCVAIRDVTKNRFVFFSQPLTVLQFKRKNLFDIFWKQRAHTAFLQVEKMSVFAA